MKKNILKISVPWALSLLLLFLSSCSSVKLISDYDEVSYTRINEVQEKITGFFVDLDSEVGTTKGQYSNHKDFYRDLKVQTETLKLRANALDKNAIVIAQISELEKDINNLEKLDKAGIKSVEEVGLLRTAFQSSLTAMIKLQLALKRGKK